MVVKRSWGQAISKLLPGDHIHDMAPSSKQRNHTSQATVAVIDTAQMKRLRKAQKAKTK